MTTSEQINELAAALAKAQAEMGLAAKDSANPFFKSTYADLASVRGACLPALTKQGIAVVQSPSAEGAVVCVDTLLLHSSGQWVRGSASATARDASPQSVGSAITYLRRYALQAFAGVAPADDDGEAAQQHTGVTGEVTAPALRVDRETGAELPAGFALIDEVKQDGAFTQVFWGRDAQGGWRKFTTKLPHIANQARKAHEDGAPVRIHSKDGKYLDRVERLDAVEAA